MVIISSSELAREVLRDYHQQLADRTRSRSSAQFSRGGKDLIWADYGPHYVKVREVCTLELLSAKRLEALRPIREDEVTAMVEAILGDCTLPPGVLFYFIFLFFNFFLHYYIIPAACYLLCKESILVLFMHYGKRFK